MQSHRPRVKRARRIGPALRRRLSALCRAAAGTLPDAPLKPPTPMDSVLDWLARREAFTVVQIGAYIGNTDTDPLYEFLQGTLPGHPNRLAVLVEPVREYFEELRATYGGLPNIRLENVAIAEVTGDRDMYRLESGVNPTEHGFPAWLTQTSSLRPDWVTSEQSGQSPELKAFWQQHRSVETVRCWTVDMLLEEHGLRHVDLLQIDAEGYDYRILRTIDFSRLRPTFISYERQGLQEDEEPCRTMLGEVGYVLFDWGIDTLAVALAA